MSRSPLAGFALVLLSAAAAAQAPKPAAPAERAPAPAPAESGLILKLDDAAIREIRGASPGSTATERGTSATDGSGLPSLGETPGKPSGFPGGGGGGGSGRLPGRNPYPKDTNPNL